jgi:hypothetical protein
MILASEPVPVQKFYTWIGMATLALKNGLLSPKAFVSVASSVVADLQEMTFSRFHQANVQHWEDVEADISRTLDSVLQEIKLSSQDQQLLLSKLRGLTTTVKRIYPSLIVSDYGVEVLMALYKQPTPDSSSLIEIMKKIPNTSGSSLVRTNTKKFE